MGINYFLSKEEKKEEKVKSKNNKEQNNDEVKFLELKNNVELGGNDIIYQIKQFNSGNIIITTENGKIIVFDKFLNKKKEIKINNDKKSKICIKNNFIFATHNKSLIKIWSIDNSNKNKIEIVLQGEIETNDINGKIIQISFINDDIIGIKNKNLFYYIKNEDTYIISKNISFNGDIYSFLITKDNKEIILAKYSNIYTYQLKQFKLISIIKCHVFGAWRKKLLYIDKYTFGCDYHHLEISTRLEPTNVLQLYNLRTKKLLIEATLDDYEVMYFRGGKFFISPSFGMWNRITIYTLKDLEKRNKFNENNCEDSHKNNITKKLRVEMPFRPKFLSLNGNLLCVWGKYDNYFKIYEFKYS